MAFCSGSTDTQKLYNAVLGVHALQTKQRKKKRKKGREGGGKKVRRKEGEGYNEMLVFQNSYELIIGVKCRILLGFLIHTLGFYIIFI